MTLQHLQEMVDHIDPRGRPWKAMLVSIHGETFYGHYRTEKQAKAAAQRAYEDVSWVIDVRIADTREVTP